MHNQSRKKMLKSAAISDKGIRRNFFTYSYTRVAHPGSQPCAPDVIQVFSLAPMMEYTDRHMRFLLRLLTTRTVLWTEMVPASTIMHNSDGLKRFLAYNDEVEHPVVLQVRRRSHEAYVTFPPRVIVRCTTLYR